MAKCLTVKVPQKNTKKKEITGFQNLCKKSIMIFCKHDDAIKLLIMVELCIYAARITTNKKVTL